MKQVTLKKTKEIAFSSTVISFNKDCRLGNRACSQKIRNLGQYNEKYLNSKVCKNKKKRVLY